ncbi:BON domain-containing protein [Cupriavidus basilensis]|uniref:BON domain-containing protein n=1 Tax=Cupriavidus basilensis TaxID=68895 RepID=UPI00030DF26D|nr:BON domain-containing protein [Cupriavidus basilensis]
MDVGDVTVDVATGVVTLGGTVRQRREKYVIEEIADAVFGVMEVENHLRVLRPSGAGWATGSDTGDDEEALRGADTVPPNRTLNKS